MKDIQVITGCMFAGKTTELIDRLKSTNQKYFLVIPKIDTRDEDGKISTHDGVSEIGIRVNRLSEVFKKLPNLPEFIEKANDAITLIAEGKLNINSGDSNAFREEKMKLKLFRNNLVGLFLVLVIFILIVFKLSLIHI